MRPRDAPVSLVIPSRNRHALLRSAVDSILRGTSAPREIVIVDQSEKPDGYLSTLRSARSCDIRYLWSPAVGVSLARNTGIAASRYEILVFIDDDIIVAVDWLDTIVGALLGLGEKAVVTGRVLATDSSEPDAFAPSTSTDARPALYEGRVGKDVLYTANMAISRSTIDQVGSFDERFGPGTRFPAAEDNDFGFRLLEAGFRIVYVPDAVAHHRAWRAARDYLALRWDYGRGQGAFLAKHFSRRNLYTLGRAARSIIAHAHGAARGIRHRELRRAYGNILYSLGILSGFAEWLLATRGDS